MTENCSSNLNRDDSFNNLTESHFDFSIGERPETVGSSTPSDKTNNELKNIINVLTLEMNKEKSKNKINKLTNKRKTLPLELLDDLLKAFDRRFFWHKTATNILSSSYLVYVVAKEILKKPKDFKYVKNKWKLIIDYKCCKNKCVNPNNPNGFCIKGNGYIQIKSNTEIEYINCKVNGKNKLARIEAKNNFNKPNDELIKTSTLYYYEVKLIFEKNGWITIGLTNENDYLYFSPSSKSIHSYELDYIKLPSFNYKTNDIIGCGLVYPPPNMTNKLPYIFFTKNGEQIAILLEEDYESFRPYVGLSCCSIETNFGENSFIYVSKHCVTEEFYKEEEFGGEAACCIL